MRIFVLIFLFMVAFAENSLLNATYTRDRLISVREDQSLTLIVVPESQDNEFKINFKAAYSDDGGIDGAIGPSTCCLIVLCICCCCCCRKKKEEDTIEIVEERRKLAGDIIINYEQIHVQAETNNTQHSPGYYQSPGNAYGQHPVIPPYPNSQSPLLNPSNASSSNVSNSNMEYHNQTYFSSPPAYTSQARRY